MRLLSVFGTKYLSESVVKRKFCTRFKFNMWRLKIHLTDFCQPSKRHHALYGCVVDGSFGFNICDECNLEVGNVCIKGTKTTDSLFDSRRDGHLKIIIGQSRSVFAPEKFDFR